MKNRRLMSLFCAILISLTSCRDIKFVYAKEINPVYEKILRQYDKENRERASSIVKSRLPNKEKISLQDLKVARLCGYFNDTYIIEPFYSVRIGESWLVKNVYEDTENDIYFEDYDSEFPPLVYRDNVFYSLKEAFDLKVLDKNNYALKSMLSAGNLLDEKMNGRGWQASYADYLNATVFKDSEQKITREEVENGGYFYGYNKGYFSRNTKSLEFYTFNISRTEQLSGESFKNTYSIGGEQFSVLANHMPLAFCSDENTFYSLEECFDSGWVDNDDLQTIDLFTQFRIDKTIGWNEQFELFN